MVGGAFRDIIERAKAGDEDAAAVLYDNHVAMVHGYFRACGVGDLDDLTSEVFLGMLRSLERFEGDQPQFRRWLMTIAHRRRVDYRRRHGGDRIELVDPSYFDQTPSVNATELFSGGVDRQLIAAFTQLTEEQREVMALRFIADVSLEGVASITGRPVGAVKSLQHRGLAALRKRLAERELEQEA